MSDGGEVTIRPMEPRDAEAVAGLVTELGYRRTAEQLRQWLAEMNSRSGQAVFVAERNGEAACEVAGWIDVSLEHRLQSGTFGLIGGLVVKDGLRGAGIGWRLCRRAEQWAREQGAAKIRVTSRSTREAAHRFYLRDGYETVKTSLVFEKPLQPAVVNPPEVRS